MLYPPILANTQPVFDIDEIAEGLTIYFTLASITESSELDGIDVLITQQSNNASVIKGSTTGWLSFLKEECNLNGSDGYVIVDKDNFTIKAGYLYKVQLRLTQNRNNIQTTSEWSTVMIIKPIDKPELSIIASDTFLEDGTTTVSSVTPTFEGKCNLSAESKEIEESFRFSLYTDETMTLILTSDWIAHVAGQSDSWYCNTLLQNQNTYIVVYEIKTANGYYAASDPRTFLALQSTSGDLDVVFRAEANVALARVDLYISKMEGSDINYLVGDYVISRTSEESDLQRFEDILFLTYDAESLASPVLAFSDYTIESGVKYQYAIQKFNAFRSRTNLQKSIGTVVLNFEYAYLFRNGVQLQMSLNQTISSFKHTVLRNKQDTLGGKYPHLSQNGNAYYAEFALSGLISYQDNMGTFFNLDNGAYYQDELVIPSDRFEFRMGKRAAYNSPGLEEQSGFEHKRSYAFGEAGNNELYADKDDYVATAERRSSSNSHYISPQEPAPGSSEKDYSISTDLIDNNIYIERRFREKVEEFLNDFNCKLYKSATEGNIVVTLMNVTLKPVESLGRMLYEFSATAYEIAEDNLTALNDYGIIHIGSEQEQQEGTTETRLSLGQIRIMPSTEERNITELISDQEYLKVDELTAYILQSIKQIWIEVYPTKDDPIIANYFKLKVGNESLIIPTRKIYTFKIPSQITASDNEASSGVSIILPSQDKYPQILINYICITKKQYIINPSSIPSTEFLFDFDQVIWNNENFDLLSFIQQQIAYKKGWSKDTNGGWTGQDSSTGKSYKYTFDHLRSIDITTQKGAIITIGLSEEQSESFKVGYRHVAEGEPLEENNFNSNRIIFPQVQDERGDAHAKYLTIENAVSAIVNFSYYYTRIEVIETPTSNPSSDTEEEGEEEP